MYFLKRLKGIVPKYQNWLSLDDDVITEFYFLKN